MQKTYISAEQLERHSWEFAIQLHQAGYRFDWIVGVARGGAQISIYMQEVFCLLRRKEVGYAAIQAWSYTAPGMAEDEVKTRNLDTLARAVDDGQTILIVDDVFDRGTTLRSIFRELSRELQGRQVRICLGALYWKPENNRTDITPDVYYRTYAGTEWLVFPHELCGLSRPELAAKGFPAEQAGI